jgi:outer membrane receptor for monomeric catechols
MMAPRFKLKQTVLSAAVLAAFAAQAQDAPADKPDAADKAPQQQTQAPAEVAQADKPVTFPGVTVEGKQEPKQKNETRGATRTDTPLRDIPQFINTVPETVLRQQGATTLADALRNVPGISYAAPEAERRRTRCITCADFQRAAIFLSTACAISANTRAIFSISNPSR